MLQACFFALRELPLYILLKFISAAIKQDCPETYSELMLLLRAGGRGEIRGDGDGLQAFHLSAITVMTVLHECGPEPRNSAAREWANCCWAWTAAQCHICHSYLHPYVPQFPHRSRDFLCCVSELQWLYCKLQWQRKAWVPSREVESFFSPIPCLKNSFFLNFFCSASMLSCGADGREHKIRAGRWPQT